MQARSYRYVVALTLLSFVIMPASATVYQWKDKNGVKQFTQTPPPAGQQYQTVKPPPPPGDPDAPKKLEDQIQRQEAEDDVRKSESTKAEIEASNREAKRLNCEQAKASLASYQSRPVNRTRSYENGELKLMTQEQHDTRVAQLQAAISKNCN